MLKVPLVLPAFTIAALLICYHQASNTCKDLTVWENDTLVTKPLLLQGLSKLTPEPFSSQDKPLAASLAKQLPGSSRAESRLPEPNTLCSPGESQGG